MIFFQVLLRGIRPARHWTDLRWWGQRQWTSREDRGDERRDHGRCRVLRCQIQFLDVDDVHARRWGLVSEVWRWGSGFTSVTVEKVFEEGLWGKQVINLVNGISFQLLTVMDDWHFHANIPRIQTRKIAQTYHKSHFSCEQVLRLNCLEKATGLKLFWCVCFW